MTLLDEYNIIVETLHKNDSNISYNGLLIKCEDLYLASIMLLICINIVLRDELLEDKEKLFYKEQLEKIQKLLEKFQIELKIIFIDKRKY